MSEKRIATRGDRALRWLAQRVRVVLRARAMFDKKDGVCSRKRAQRRTSAANCFVERELIGAVSFVRGAKLRSECGSRCSTCVVARYRTPCLFRSRPSLDVDFFAKKHSAPRVAILLHQFLSRDIKHFGDRIRLSCSKLGI